MDQWSVVVTFSSFLQIIEFCSCLSSAFKAKFSKQSLRSALERLVCGQLFKNSDCFGWMHPSWLCIQHMSEKDPGQSHANEFLANLKPMSPLGKDRSLRWVAGAGGFWQSFVRGCYIQSAKLVFCYHKKSSFHIYSNNTAFLQLKRIGEAFTLKQQQHLPWERNSKK